MKNKIQTLAVLLAVSTLSQGAQAALELSVVSQYGEAANPAIWQKTKMDRVPESIVTQERVNNPGAAYSALFPKTFLQEADFEVCMQDCKIPDSFKVKTGDVTTLSGNELDLLEQSNVYFWLNKYFSYLDEKFAFKPKYFLKSFTNRDVKEDGQRLTNNAFFDPSNPKDLTLSFLPANKGLLFRVFSGKINRSGFDPSVISHEVSHYLFYHLYPDAVNNEINGLNEGFADYIAHTFLENPKVGLVMLRGTPLRDASNPLTTGGKAKVYAPGLEVHDLGERVAYMLWKIRELANDKVEMDRMVIDSVKELGQTPYSSVHDFKRIFKSKLRYVVDSANEVLAENLLDAVLPGEATVLANLNFISQSYTDQSVTSFETKTTSEKKEVSSSRFSMLNEVLVDKNQVALMGSLGSKTFWYAVDSERGNILGIYDVKGRLLKSTEEINSIQDLTARTLKFNANKIAFAAKIKTFLELYNGQGSLSSVYKVKEKSVDVVQTSLNGQTGDGHQISMKLGKKLIGSLIPGLTNVDSITITTSSLQTTKWMTLNGEAVIGYKIVLKDGSESEALFDRIAH
jgi:hypothetical protein